MVGHKLIKMNFRWAIASEIGTSHLKDQTKRQDCARCFRLDNSKGQILVAIVCDGAGSALYGRDGAILTCRILTNLARDYFKRNIDLPSNDLIWSWIDQVRDYLGEEAEKRSCGRKDFSSTLVMLIAGSSDVLTIHVGDGAIVARDENKAWICLSNSENGEYASTTFFITEDPCPKLRIQSFPNTYTAFSLFSDGIEDLAIVQSSKNPHVPFFEKMILSVDQGKMKGNLSDLSNSLGSFLSSSKVCDRTDDDKSLILISSK